MLKWICIFIIGFSSLGAKNFDNKIYIPNENVKLENNQILVGNRSKWISIAQIAADANGYYLTSQEKDYSLFQWECPRCGHDNWFWEDICYVCGYKLR